MTSVFKVWELRQGYIFSTSLWVLFLIIGLLFYKPFNSYAYSFTTDLDYIQQVDSPEVVLPFPLSDDIDPFTGTSSRIDFNDPENVTTTIEYDPVTGQYILVNDESIIAAIGELGRVGVFAEPAGAAAYAGLVEAISKGVRQTARRCLERLDRLRARFSANKP